MLHFTPFGYLLCATLLFARREDADKSRVLLALSFFVWGCLMFGSLLYHYTDKVATTHEVLSMSSLNITLFAFFIIFLYPIEIIAPGRLTLKNILLLFGSNILLTLILLISRPEFTDLRSFDEIFQHIGSYNVLFRFIVAIYITTLAFFIFFVPYTNSRSRVNLLWIRLFFAGVFISTLLYVIWILTGSTILRLLMQIYCLGFCLIVTYQELYLRISNSSASAIYVKKATLSITSKEPVSVSKDVVLMSPIWKKLTILIEQQPIWRNPDLTLVELASMLGTNRTTLSNLIRDAGYDGFYGFLNTYRIKEFIKIIEKEEITSIHETFFDVGFRSKSTAVRYFRKETGTTPSEYLQRHNLDI